MTRSQWCLSFSRITFLLFGVASVVNVVNGDTLLDYKCTYGNYGPGCACPTGIEIVVGDRCDAGVPPDGSPNPLNTECGPMTSLTCGEYPDNDANLCGIIWLCTSATNENCDSGNATCSGPSSPFNHICPCCLEFIGTDAQCLPFPNKPQCSGTWGKCKKSTASW